MEVSPANRLPEADSLPDGFVEISADLSPPPTPDYKESFVDRQTPDEQIVDPYLPPSGSGEEAVSPGLLVNGSEKLIASTGISAKRDSVGDCPNSTGRDGISETKSDNEASESSIPKNEVLLGTATEGNSQGDGKSSETETKDKMELHPTSLKQKEMQDECQRVSTEGQNMRQDLSTKFSDAIKDISHKLEVQKDDCLSQLNENEMLRNKLKLLADQYALSEQHFGQKLQQKALELQLADLKLQQQDEKSAKEQTQIQLYAEQVSQLLTTEKNLRLQLAADEERFQQFQDALSKSNEVFEAFKLEMEKMTKLIKELKKENEFLKGKCEKSDIAIVKLIEERELMKKQLDKVKTQKEKLESLCRSLQSERKHNLVKANSDPVAAQVSTSSEDP